MAVINDEGFVLVNLTEIADRWGVTVSSVQRYHVDSGRLRTRRSGRSHLVLIHDLRKYEEHLIDEVHERINQEKARLDRLSAPLDLPDRVPVETLPK